MSLEITTIQGWDVVHLGERVDAFNFESMKDLFAEAGSEIPLVALHLRGTGFLSLPFIKYLHSRAIELNRQGGTLALISPTEKIKRQFDIFASLEPLHVFATEDEWLSRQGRIKALLPHNSNSQHQLQDL